MQRHAAAGRPLASRVAAAAAPPARSLPPLLTPPRGGNASTSATTGVGRACGHVPRRVAVLAPALPRPDAARPARCTPAIGRAALAGPALPPARPAPAGHALRPAGRRRRGNVRPAASGGAEAAEAAAQGAVAVGDGDGSKSGSDADDVGRRGPPATPGPLQRSGATDSADEDDDGSNTSSTPALPRPSTTDGLGADVAASAADGATPRAGGPPGRLYPPAERTKIAKSWDQLMRWSRKNWRAQRGAAGRGALDAVDKVVVFGGGSFGTAMAAALARQKPALDVVLLLRDPALVADINATHVNARYLPDASLPLNVRASADAAEAIGGAQYALHAVPVQHSRAFLASVAHVLPPTVPVISVSKGLEVGTGALMSDLIPDALGRKQPTAFLSGPSFAAEVMARSPTGLVAASRDKALKRAVQGLFASPYMRVNTSSDVVGVEVCGALKNVLAIAAGIVEGLDLGMNARAALVAQGCAEIRWLAEKMGAKPATVAGLSGLGDIMLTCYGSLSRNRSVGVRLGRGERLGDILASSSQVAEGVATAGVVVALASKYHVQLPVLTAVAQVLAGALSPEEAVAEIMGLPQVEER